MNELAKFLVESILSESEQEIVVLFPGGFKPPHGGHLDIAKRYAKLSNVAEVRILVGPKEREGITRDQSIAVWKELLINSPKVTVESISEDNPIKAAYEYIQKAEPGTYALAASSKGDDYARVKSFVEKHAEGSKYHRPEVNVVELTVNTEPLLYKNRKDNLNGKGVSASTLRADLTANNYINFKTNYPGVSDSSTKSIFDILVKNTNKTNTPLAERFLLQEGGAAGHMSHPYEDYDLTFQDVENMIDAALSGKIEFAQEKLDGQNLMVTYKDGKVRAARNKGHLKNAGENSLTLQQIKDTFANRGSIQTAFSEAMVDLETAINRLTPNQKADFFGNGTKFVNFEILFPETANVIPYGATQLRLHNITEYDPAGNVVNTDTEKVYQLEKAIRQVEAQNQKTYEIRVTDPVTINKSADFEKQRDELTKIIKTLRAKFNLKLNDRVSSYIQAWWKQYINNTAKQYNYNIPDDVLQQLVNRWGFSNKDVNIKVIRDGIKNEDFRNWVSTFDKGEYVDQKKICIKPIETLFLKLGVYVLKNISQIVAINPDESVRQIKSNLDDAISKIKAAANTPDMNDDGASMKFLKRELTRLKDVGGFKAILPVEGVVFKYNGKLYKLTGAFAPINSILGYLKF